MTIVLPHRKVHSKPPIEGGVYLPEALEFLGVSKSFFYGEIRRNLIPKPQSWTGKSFWLIDDLQRYIRNKLESKGA